MRTHRTLFALYLLFFGEVFRIEGAGGVQDSEDHDADIGEDGHPHVGDTQSTQQQAGRLDGQSKDDVLVAQECRECSSLRRSRTAVLPSGCDALRHILLGIIWRIAGGRFAAPLHRVAPTPRTALSA